jgi:hypothetical protein
MTKQNRMRGAWTAVLVMAALALAPAAARAQATDSTKAQAQAAMREGNALLEQGHASEALSKFTDAYRLFPSPKLHYNIGQAQSLIPGHEAQAYEAMSRFLKEAKDASPELRAAAEAARRQLRSKVGLVTVAADPPDAELVVDEVAAGKVPPDAPLVLGPGKHTLAIKKDGLASPPETVTIAGGETSDVRLRVARPVAPPPPQPPAPAPPAPVPAVVPAPAPPPPVVASNTAPSPAATLTQPAPPPPARGYWTRPHKIGAALMAAGAASLIFGVIEHVSYFSKADEFKKRGCGTNDLTVGDGCKGLDDDFKSAQTLWIAGYIGAAALGGAGAYFLWLAPTDQPGAGEGGAVASVSPGFTINFKTRF